MRKWSQRLRNSLAGADPNRIHFQKYATTSVEIICSELSFYLRFDLRVENFTCGVRCGECKRSLCQIQVFIIIIYLLLIIIIKIIKNIIIKNKRKKLYMMVLGYYY